MKKLAFTKDGSVTVVYSTDEAAQEGFIIRNEIADDAIKLKDSFVVEDYFYDALKITGKKLSIDSEKAKEIQLNLWREARKQKFIELDLQFMRALETGDDVTVKEVAAKKQALRDVTLTPLSKVPSKIKATWPEILL